jgi:hypothetical protein
MHQTVISPAGSAPARLSRVRERRKNHRRRIGAACFLIVVKAFLQLVRAFVNQKMKKMQKKSIGKT